MNKILVPRLMHDYPESGRLQEAYKIAEAEARKRKQWIGTEDLLLALAKVKDSIAYEMLQKCGISYDYLVDALNQIMAKKLPKSFQPTRIHLYDHKSDNG